MKTCASYSYLETYVILKHNKYAKSDQFARILKLQVVNNVD